SGLDRTACGNCSRDTTDRYARSEGRCPLSAEFEVFPGDEIDERPINEICLYYGAKTSEHYRGCEPQFFSGSDAEKTPQDYDGGLNVQLGADSLLDSRRKGGEEVA